MTAYKGHQDESKPIVPRCSDILDSVVLSGEDDGERSTGPRGPGFRSVMTFRRGMLGQSHPELIALDLESATENAEGDNVPGIHRPAELREACHV